MQMLTMHRHTSTVQSQSFQFSISCTFFLSFLFVKLKNNLIFQNTINWTTTKEIEQNNRKKTKKKNSLKLQLIISDTICEPHSSTRCDRIKIVHHRIRKLRNFSVLAVRGCCWSGILVLDSTTTVRRRLPHWTIYKMQMLRGKPYSK